MASGICPTCAAVEAVLLASRRVPKPIAKKIARSNTVRGLDKAIKTEKMVRRASNYSRKLKKHLRMERAKQTKNNGDFKKGKSMSTVMRAAHKCVKKEMKQ